MSAERHALDAALAFSQGLESQIKRLKLTIEECSRENLLLRSKIDHVKDAVHEKERPETGPMCEASMPQGMQAGPHEDMTNRQEAGVFTNCRHCKNCGAPV